MEKMFILTDEEHGIFKYLWESYNIEKSLLNKKYFNYGNAEFYQDSYLAKMELKKATKEQKEAELNMLRHWQKVFFNILSEHFKDVKAGAIHKYFIDGIEKKFITERIPNNIYFKVLQWITQTIYSIERWHPDLKTKTPEAKPETIFPDLLKHEQKEPFHGGIEKHEYNLRQFIDFAIRYDIEAVYNARTDKDKFPYQDYQIENLWHFSDLFNKELIYKLSNVTIWKAIEIDIKSKFLPMINQYIEWYETNKNELVKFEPNNFYDWFYSNCKLTKKTIFDYFPENIAKQDASTKPEQTEKPKQKSKPGRPEAKYKPLESYIIPSLAYKKPLEIAAILKAQFENGKAADLKTMIDVLKKLSIWKTSKTKEEFLMLQEDFNYKEDYENYRKAKSNIISSMGKKPTEEIKITDAITKK